VREENKKSVMAEEEEQSVNADTPSKEAANSANEPERNSLEDWMKRALDGLTDQTKPFPKTW